MKEKRRRKKGRIWWREGRGEEKEIGIEKDGEKTQTFASQCFLNDWYFDLKSSILLKKRITSSNNSYWISSRGDSLSLTITIKEWKRKCTFTSVKLKMKRYSLKYFSFAFCSVVGIISGLNDFRIHFSFIFIKLSIFSLAFFLHCLLGFLCRHRSVVFQPLIQFGMAHWLGFFL